MLLWQRLITILVANMVGETEKDLENPYGEKGQKKSTNKIIILGFVVVFLKWTILIMSLVYTY